MSSALFDPDEFADAVKVLAPLIPDPAKPEPAEFHLGTRVIFSHQLYRHTEGNGYQRRKVWTPHPYYADAARARGGIVVGKRTLSNGTTQWQGDEDGGLYEFIPDEHFTAYLIAFALHRKPVYVRPQHLIPEVVSTV